MHNSYYKMNIILTYYHNSSFNYLPTYSLLLDPKIIIIDL